ncbi:MAG: BamA/TamA family outer membrane protein [Rhodobacteraceae bacterium]|nr:BamA/TamA family outer membrane protein [Paracoccaceae bacterium]
MISSLALAPAASLANGPGQVESQFDRLQENTDEETFGFREGSVVVAPVPFSNPMFGSGLALGVGYLFKDKARSNTSVIGLGGVRSDNGSKAAAALINLSLDNNRWKISAFAGQADVNYDLFIGNRPFPIKQDGLIGRLQLAYGPTETFSFGTTIRYLDTTVAPELPNLPPLPPPVSLDASLKLVTFGINADWDKRNDSDYPTEGQRISFAASYGTSIEGLSRDYEKAWLLWDTYMSLTPQGVLAFRTALCGASSETPFFDQCSIGGTDAFRGFSSAQYLDFRSTSVQVEYRQRLNKRWGVVAFGGIAWAGNTFDQMQQNGSHSAVGGGLRYRVSKKFPVDFSVDYSFNNESEQLLYIYVGQRF